MDASKLQNEPGVKEIDSSSELVKVKFHSGDMPIPVTLYIEISITGNGYFTANTISGTLFENGNDSMVNGGSTTKEGSISDLLQRLNTKLANGSVFADWTSLPTRAELLLSRGDS